MARRILDGVVVHFNENLNVTIGGRGSGKSTMVESVRYVLGLEPLGKDATATYEGILKNVLRNGTKITLVVRSYQPAKLHYIIERTVPGPSIVRDQSGVVVALNPRDVIPQAEVYGQHEISELTKSPEKLTRLLERFIDGRKQASQPKADILLRLEKSRQSINNTERELKQIDERLAALPGLEETLKRYQDAGLEERLKDKSVWLKKKNCCGVRAKRYLNSMNLRRISVGSCPSIVTFFCLLRFMNCQGRFISLRPVQPS